MRAERRQGQARRKPPVPVKDVGAELRKALKLRFPGRDPVYLHRDHRRGDAWRVRTLMSREDLKKLDKEDFRRIQDAQTGMRGAELVATLKRLALKDPEDLVRQGPSQQQLLALYALSGGDGDAYLQLVHQFFGDFDPLLASRRVDSDDRRAVQAHKEALAQPETFLQTLWERQFGKLAQVKKRGGRGDNYTVLERTGDRERHSAHNLLQDLMGHFHPGEMKGRSRNLKGKGVVARGGFGHDRFEVKRKLQGASIHTFSGNDRFKANGVRMKKVGVQMGEGADVLDASGRVADSIFRMGNQIDRVKFLGTLLRTDVHLDQGNDEAELVGELRGVEVRGDHGSDAIRVAGNLRKVEINAGDHGDLIQVGSLFQDAVVRSTHIDGQDGDDSIVLQGKHRGTDVNLGEGNDALFISKDFRGDVVVRDNDRGRIKTDGDLRGQDSIVLGGPGWERRGENLFVRTNQKGKVIARVRLGDGDENRIEQVVTSTNEKLKDVKPEVEKKGGFFRSTLGRVLGAVLGVAAAAVTGGAGLALTIASAVYNAVSSFATGNILGGLASAVGLGAFLPGISKAAGQVFSKISQGIRAAYGLVKGGVWGLLSAAATVLGWTGKTMASIGTSIGSRIVGAIETGKVTLESVLGLVGDGIRWGRAVDARRPLPKEEVQKRKELRSGLRDIVKQSADSAVKRQARKYLRDLNRPETDTDKVVSFVRVNQPTQTLTANQVTWVRWLFDFAGEPLPGGGEPMLPSFDRFFLDGKVNESEFRAMLSEARLRRDSAVNAAGIAQRSGDNDRANAIMQRVQTVYAPGVEVLTQIADQWDAIVGDGFMTRNGVVSE